MFLLSTKEKEICPSFRPEITFAEQSEANGKTV
jgi:hypothetical protein